MNCPLETDRRIDRPTDRQTDRPTDRQTDRQTDGQTDRQTDTPARRATSATVQGLGFALGPATSLRGAETSRDDGGKKQTGETGGLGVISGRMTLETGEDSVEMWRSSREIGKVGNRSLAGFPLDSCQPRVLIHVAMKPRARPAGCDF